jgi:hypothetical protein
VAILAGALVASLGIVIALRMPASPARVRGGA